MHAEILANKHTSQQKVMYEAYYCYFQTGWTPLIIASRNGLVDIVRLMVEKILTFSDTERQKELDRTRKVRYNAGLRTSFTTDDLIWIRIIIIVHNMVWKW